VPAFLHRVRALEYACGVHLARALGNTEFI
jgi:hypothetical protein